MRKLTPLLILTFTACHQQTPPPTPIIHVTIQLPDALTNLYKPQFITRKDETQKHDFQIFERKTGPLLLVDHATGRTWQLWKLSQHNNAPAWIEIDRLQWSDTNNIEELLDQKE